MKSVKILGLVLVLFCTQVGQILAADEATLNEVSVERNVILVVQEKDPRTVYQNSLVPVFGPIWAAEYVSYTPVTWETNLELKKKAQRQMLWNLGMVLGGVCLDLAISGEQVKEDDYGYSEITEIQSGIFTVLGFVGSLVHNHFFGKDMAEVAVTYNRKLHEEFKWSYPLLSISF